MATTNVLSIDPDLAGQVPAHLRAAAGRACVARAVRVGQGDWDPRGERDDPGGFGLLVLAGHLVRRVGREDRVGAELLGPGDLLRPWQLAAAEMPPFEPRWIAVTPVELAVLDSGFARRAARFPGIAIEIVERAMQRSRHLANAIAIAHRPRVDERLHRLLWSYADRWGTVGTAGVTLELPLTHGTLAELAAARRPTVSTALSGLAASGLVERVGSAWILRGAAPDAALSEP